jgi:hypothetical protein
LVTRALFGHVLTSLISISSEYFLFPAEIVMLFSLVTSSMTPCILTLTSLVTSSITSCALLLTLSSSMITVSGKLYFLSDLPFNASTSLTSLLTTFLISACPFLTTWIKELKEQTVVIYVKS